MHIAHCHDARDFVPLVLRFLLSQKTGPGKGQKYRPPGELG